MHYGILGMHWGVRRSGGAKSTGKKSARGKSEGSEDYKNSKALQKKGSKNLSTKELKDLTQRLQLEQQYKTLNKSKTDKGLDYVKKATAAGTTVAALYGLSKTPLGQDVTKAIKGAMSDAALKTAYKAAMGG